MAESQLPHPCFSVAALSAAASTPSRVYSLFEVILKHETAFLI